MNSRLIFHKAIYFLLYGIFTVSIQKYYHLDTFTVGWFVGLGYALIDDFIFYTSNELKSKYRNNG